MNKKHNVYIYHPQLPFDYWNGWVPIKNYLNFLRNDSELNNQFNNFFVTAMFAALEIDLVNKTPWESPVSEYYVAKIDFRYPRSKELFVVAWKQDEKMYVVSSSELPVDLDEWSSNEAPILGYNCVSLKR